MYHKKITQYLFAFMLLSVLTLTCTGCAVSKVLKNISSELTKPDPFNQAVDDFFAALDARDKEAIKEMFAQSVQNEDAELEEQIEQLMKNYPGPTEYCGRNGADHESRSSSKGKHTSSGWSPFPVISNGEYYWCTFEITYENDSDRDKVGITQVCFFSFNDYCDIRYDEDKKYPAENGLIVCFDYPLDCEVRSIAGQPYKYTARKKNIDESEVKEFLKEEDYDICWWQFEERFGRPNSFSGPPDYVYEHVYELSAEDGEPRYLMVSGDNEIYSIGVYDDLKLVYNIWNKRDDK